MNQNRVFITRDIPKKGLNFLHSQGFQIEIYKSDSPIPYDVLLESAKHADYLITMLTDKIDAHFLEQNAHLKMITNFAVGLNNIDIETATRKNIYIGHTPDVLTNATAEIAIGLLIMCMRNFHQSHQAIINDEFKSFNPLGFLGNSLAHKTLGIIGLGRIGLEVARICQKAFHMDVLYTSETSVCEDYTKVELEELLKRSDAISLHCPLTPKTKNLIAKKELALLKENAVIINTARGEVINQEDLYQALVLNPNLRAGLDVTTPEPLPKNHPLKSLPNCYILPHIGSASIETRESMSLLCAENIVNLKNNLLTKSMVNGKLIKPRP